MKTYENTVRQGTYRYFYDRSIQSWTVYEVEGGFQVDDAEYFPNKKSLLANYKFDFKKTVKK
jgi:hypothetical protein